MASFAYTDTPLFWAIDLVLEENHLLGRNPLHGSGAVCRVWEYQGVFVFLVVVVVALKDWERLIIFCLLLY